MNHARYSLGWLLLVVGVGVFAACLGRLPELSNTGQQPNVQVITAALTGTAVLGTATVDPNALTLTANLTAPPLPPPTFYTPNPLNAEGTPKTATPLPATLAPGQTPATMPPPPTVRVGKRIDLTHGTPVPSNELIAQFVKRADGTLDTYLIPPWLFLGTGAEIEARLNQLLEIKHGDEMLGWTNVTQPDGTPTPLPTQPIHKVVDLAHGTPVSDGEMIVMHVHRANGTYDEYWVPLVLLKGATAEINARLDQLMEIQPGDERFWWRTVVGATALHVLPTIVSTPTP